MLTFQHNYVYTVLSCTFHRAAIRGVGRVIRKQAPFLEAPWAAERWFRFNETPYRTESIYYRSPGAVLFLGVHTIYHAEPPTKSLLTWRHGSLSACFLGTVHNEFAAFGSRVGRSAIHTDDLICAAPWGGRFVDIINIWQCTAFLPHHNKVRERTGFTVQS